MIKNAQQVNLATRSQPAPIGNLVFPGTEYLADIEVDGQRVGHISYSINPLRDRVYISKIEIHADHRRHGFALGALWHLWQEHQVPIVPLHQYGTSDEFWELARERFAAAGAAIGDELRGAQIHDEMQRWQHLVPEPEHLRLQREVMASPEWPAIKAKWDAEYGPDHKD